MRSLSVGEVMTREVVHVRRTEPGIEVARLLSRHGISGLPVVDSDDKVLGVISGSDLRALTAEDGRAPEAACTAADLMTSPAITVHPEQPVPDAARVMERRGIERLPVVDEEDRLIGIVTRRDLLRVFLRTDDDIRRQVTEDVVGGELGLPAEAVSVSVRDGVVTFRGLLERRSDVPVAVHAAWRLDGVVGVVNHLAYRVDDCAPPAAASRVVSP
ncbi:hypothetical protein GCM10010503_19300 [Streptomyces lucensis JCM 4490]|uniref:CBS domain-containing protein n=1 Tax=Streptomyces lucensis JCM 4490 TaxID=1306176 RepID=A0A918J1E1_9ACTN|nr:CBS domain-containing protein [Streptomyces lucensis]GGW42910.1 hypothetical protein GCM10010503_19300 [Streptomyces lucensis JCM 4490]